MGWRYPRRLPFALTALTVAESDSAAGPAATGETVLVRVSHYWPPLGGPNCARFVDGECLSRMSSGEAWQDWVERAIACPSEWEFGTRVVVSGREWVCMDRGGAIVYEEDGIPWVDMLTPQPLFPHGTVVEASLIHP